MMMIAVVGERLDAGLGVDHHRAVVRSGVAVDDLAAEGIEHVVEVPQHGDVALARQRDAVDVLLQRLCRPGVSPDLRVKNSAVSHICCMVIGGDGRS